jgi:hypothetical protein
MSKLSFLISSGELFSSRKAPQSWSSLAALRPVLMVSGLAVGASAAMAGPGFVDATLNNGASTRQQSGGPAGHPGVRSCRPG